VPLLVRSWNVFHGNADPPRRRGYLHEMVKLATADEPDVLCLQELPIWSLPFLGMWSGMQSEAAIARPPFWPGTLAAWITRLNQGLFRSAISGQANAILVAGEHVVEDLGKETISDRGRERRVVQALRVNDRLVVANLHATNDFRRPEVPRNEVERARQFAEGLARPDEPVVLAGDFNVPRIDLPDYSAPADGIDHVLVHGAASSPLYVWPRERRVENGLVLSDHPPVELRLEEPE
jgi:endonuclease/exonuclease/phosphatase family metal-dependent hydrolase